MNRPYLQGIGPWLALLPVVGCTPLAEPLDTAARTVAAEPEAWEPRVFGRIDAEAYRFTAERDAIVGAAGRPGIATRLERGGATLRAGDDTLRLAFSAWGREGALIAVAPVVPALGACVPSGEVGTDGVCLPRAEYDHDGVLEWWAHRDVGVQQGWEVRERPAGDGPVVFAVEAPGAEVRSDVGGDVVWLEHDGRTWSYSDAVAWDARGMDVPVELTERDGSIAVLVDDTDAIYPLYVDPLSSTPSATLSGPPVDKGQFGFAVAAAGDFNGDGYGDFVVGAPYFSNPEVDEGAVFVFPGSAAGPGGAPMLTIESNKAGSLFGWSVAGGAKLNNDVFADLVVGAPGTTFVSKDDGFASVYLGAKAPDAVADYTRNGAGIQRLGESVAVGNVNGAGYDELLLGAPLTTSTDLGAVFIISDDDGFGVGAVQTSTRVDGTVASGFVGRSIAVTKGTVTLDGNTLHDVIVGAPGYSGGAGAIHIMLGRTDVTKMTYDVVAVGAGGMGETVAVTKTSYDADGWPDVAAGAPFGGAPLSAGEVTVYKGTGNASAIDPTPLQTTNSTAAAANHGAGLAFGDTNGDGYDDLAVGRPGADRVLVYNGGVLRDSAFDWSYTHAEVGSRLGGGLALADVKGKDGVLELLGGAPRAAAGGIDRGQVFGFADVFLDADGDGRSEGPEDCDDANATVFKGAPELVYNVDSDCDGNRACYTDADRDGFGTKSLVEETDADKSCNEPTEGTANDASDCLDTDPAHFPGALETAYGKDKDCDNHWMCYKDADKDGSGVNALVEEVDGDKNCNEPADLLADDALDCNDADPAYAPTAAEVTYNLDKDCDGNVACYADVDQDTYGATKLVEETDKDKNCNESLEGTANDNTDCLDTSAKSNPAAPEIPGDSLDNNCVGGEQCYYDGDQDGFGTSKVVTESVDTDLDCEAIDREAVASTDCNDTTATITKGSAEVIGDGIDQDCNGFDDCYLDKDRDGHALASGVLVPDNAGNGCITSDGEGGATTPRDDCNDSSNQVYAGAVEIVGDNLDNDCDSSELCYVDADGDAFAATSKATVPESADTDLVCEASDKESTGAGPFTDCDDAVAAVNPGKVEVCGNGIDDNCNGLGGGTSPDDDADGIAFAREQAAGSNDCDVDSDDDGTSDAVEFGPGPSPLNTDGGDLPDVLDLDDDNDGVPSVGEGSGDADSDGIPNPLDPDDDGDGIATIDEGPTTGQDSDGDSLRDHLDSDDDGDGISTVVEGIADPDLDGEPNYLDDDSDGDGDLDRTDCGPLDASAFAGAAEVCNERDDDCDGTVDDGAPGTIAWFADADGDSYGTPDDSLVTCSPPPGYADRDGDCDDTEASFSPDGVETCAPGDEDCDGGADELDPQGAPTDGRSWYLDDDADSWGDDAVERVSCTGPSGYADRGGDCDVDDPAINPDGVEVCGNGVDEDCTGVPDDGAGALSWYPDADGDGFGDADADATEGCAVPAEHVVDHTDCDDENAAVSPEAPEVPGNGLDDDCDAGTPDATDTGETDTVETDTNDTATSPPAIVCGCRSSAGGSSLGWALGLLAGIAARRATAGRRRAGATARSR